MTTVMLCITAQWKKFPGLKKKGKVFVFAPSRHTRARAFTMNEKVEQGLYELAIHDFTKQEKNLKKFLESA